MLVENARDILDALAQQGGGAMEAGRDLFDWGPFDRGAGEAPGDDYAPEITAKVRSQVFEALSYTPLHRDEILREIEAPTGLILDALLDLVLSGEAEEHSGGRFSLAAD
ncbi:MAG: hypothetical protein R3C51_10935 [Parvularculaceae bacterium]